MSTFICKSCDVDLEPVKIQKIQKSRILAAKVRQQKFGIRGQGESGRRGFFVTADGKSMSEYVKYQLDGSLK